jgi:hypothetical protein
MAMTATYSGEELNVTFVAQTERSDYGVPNSPVWYEVNPDSIEILHFDILGIDVDPANFAARIASRDLCALQRSGV